MSYGSNSFEGQLRVLPVALDADRPRAQDEQGVRGLGRDLLVGVAEVPAVQDAVTVRDAKLIDYSYLL